MKKIIDGLLFDTETAELITEWENHYHYGDSSWCQEKLFKTKKGRYFLYGKGGPLSIYSVPVGNNASGGGEDIRLLSKEEALAWCGEKGIVEEVLGEFAELIKEG